LGLVRQRNDGRHFLAILLVPPVVSSGGAMSLNKKYIRDGQRRIIGSVTTGYTGSFDTIVRDEHEHIVGWSSEKFHTTRDHHGNLVSINPGLLIGRRKP
jgi:hypothetical protein